MSLHQYQVDVEYNDDPGYFPITVTVNHHKEEPAFLEISGKES